MTQRLKMVGLMGWTAAAANQHGWRKGPWTAEEDKLLTQHVALRGDGRWSSVARCAGLNRSGKSCRLRWVNYLRPGLKKGQITPQEESVIIELHALWGNKWSTIARYLPGRTDNEIKNYWRTHFRKKEKLSRKSLLAGRKFLQKLKSKPQPQQPPDQPLPMELPASSSSSSSEQSLTVPTSSWMDGTCHDQDGSWWGGLWNVVDHQGPVVGMDQIQQLQQQQQQQQGDHYCCKMASSVVQNDHATTNYNFISTANNNNIINNNNGFSWGGDLISNFNYNGECIF